MLKFKKMGSEKIPLLLITANVGSIFESPAVMLPVWMAEFLQTVSRMEPKFVALHMQEVGGKTYEKSMQCVQRFVEMLCESAELRLFDKIRIYLDEDYSSAEKFTALGNIYFIHSTLNDVKLWDFLSQEWVPADGKEVHAGNIENVSTKEKAKFPQHFFPECKWSRKGFMRVRWLVRNTAFELINVHLFHDASNLLAAEASPSVYCRSRRRALRHTLQHIHQDPKQPPFFIFGDFNFRLDTAGVVKKLSDNLKANRAHNGKSVEHTKLQFKDQKDDKIVLTVGKKEFTHVDHQKVFREPWVLKFDKELDALKPHLFEFPIKFPPSYPFEEDIELPVHYMKTRCPAWCDRILLSQTARLIINHLDGQKLMPKDPAESRRSIVEQMDGVFKHGSRRSIAESTDSGGGSPSKSSHRSSGQSSSESSPARSASPIKYNLQINSPAKKAGCVEFDGLSVPTITQSRKSIADPTNIVHAMNARSEIGEASPTKRRLVRNQSEGSPKMGEHLDMRKITADSNPSLRKRAEYGIIGENTCMGDHKPVYLRILLQSDKGTVRCCAQDPPDKYCYIAPPEIQSETCFRHSSAHNLSKCPSRECFEPLSVQLQPFRLRLASRISCDSGVRGLVSSKDSSGALVRLGTDPSLVSMTNFKDLTQNSNNTTLNNLDTNNRSAKNSSLSINNCNEKYDDFDAESSGVLIPNVQITTAADYCNYEGMVVNNNIDTHLLYSSAGPLDPYTPESIESRSPYPEYEIGESEVQFLSNDLDKDALPKLESELDFNSRKVSIDRTEMVNKAMSVSPRQLKSRLENILRSSRNNIESSQDSLKSLRLCEVDTKSTNKEQSSENIEMNESKKGSDNKKDESECGCFGCRVC